MRTQHSRDTLKDLWEVIQPTRINKEAIQQVSLLLSYRLNPCTHHIGYAISIELGGDSLRRIYNWESPPDFFKDIPQEFTEESWNRLLEGLAATVTGIVSPRKECRTGPKKEPNSAQ